MVAMFYISEEIFVRKLDVEASLGVALEGFWGIIIMSIILPLLNGMENPFIPGVFFENI